jgi:hypothetical protein
MTRNSEAIPRLFRNSDNRAANFDPQPAIFPAYSAPVIRQAIRSESCAGELKMLYYILEKIVSPFHGFIMMATRDPFESSVMARPAIVRLGVVTCVIVALWLAIAWAAALA